MGVERIARRAWLGLIGGLLLTGCASIAPTTRITLLAPFEGRYREVGYNALYAARLAVQDAGGTSVELLPIDDGGSAASAADRARALRLDPQVAIVLMLGPAVGDPAVQAAAGDLPLIVIGDWGVEPAAATFILANPASESQVTVSPQMPITEAARLNGPLIGTDSLALAQWPRLQPASDDVTILSSATLPDPAFAERYRGSDPFAPEPGLLASLTYDATRLALQTIQSAPASRAALTESLKTITYEGLNGFIRFEHGYWADAPLNAYRYAADGTLSPIEDVVK